MKNFPNKKYNIILCDPPWKFRNYNDETATKFVGNIYPLMDTRQICSLDIPKIAEMDCALFMWTTFPKLEEAFVVMKAWGFTYKTVAFVWVKQNKKSEGLFFGMGYYTRSNAEICLLATKGKPLERKSHSVHSIIVSRVEEHSKKPREVRERIVELFGDLPRIELFAREKVKGWSSWGNQIRGDGI